jgi:hypothetical protein
VEPASRPIARLEQARVRFSAAPLQTFVIATCLLLIARFIPAVAILVVWPFLFVIPGWLLAARVVPALSPVGRLGAGIAISVVATAHLVNAIGFVAGRFDRDIALIAAFVLIGASLVLATQRLPGLAHPPAFDLARVRTDLRQYRTAWASAALGAMVVGGVLALSSWHEVDGNWVSGGWNWSDFLVHVSIGASLLAGNFPPQVPYAAGAPLAYHWFADFHGAITAATAGVDVIGVFALSNAIMAAAFVLLVWELAVRVLGDRRAGVPAALLALFGGGLGWIRLPIDLAAGANNLATLLATTSYDNAWFAEWPTFKIASVLGTGFLPHRATAFGLPILVAVVLIAHVSFGRNRTGVVLAGLLAALLAPFSFFFFPAAYLIVLLDWLFQRRWQRPGWLADGVAFVAPVLLGLPFIVGPILLQQERGAFRFVAGWSEAPFEDGPAAVAFFYVTNLGLPLVLAAAAAVTRNVPARGWLVAWAVALFAVPNLVVASAVEFDMNKYFQVMWIALALLAAWLIRRWPRPAIAAIVLASALSPALVAIWHLASPAVALSGSQVRAAHWIAANTPQRSVFVTDAFINSPVDLAGRLRIVSFGPYVANLGYDATSREFDVHRIYCEGDATARELMPKYHATYVLSTAGLAACGDQPPTDFASSPAFTTVYDADGVTIWKLAQS